MTTQRFTVKCSAGNHTLRLTRAELAALKSSQYSPTGACPVCPGRLPLNKPKKIVGVLNVEVACTTRCTSAKGNECECSCTGENHGADWDIVFSG